MEEKYLAFIRVLDPNDNQTGGGAASAVGGAMAASLVGMVARVSVGKKKMVESDSYYQEVVKNAQLLSELLLTASNEDSIAFDKVMQAYRLPRGNETEKLLRLQAIQDANVGATKTPLKTARLCRDVLTLAYLLRGKSNKNVASDLDCAIFLGTAGLKGALSNIEINLDSIDDLIMKKQMSDEAELLKESIKDRGDV